MKKRTLFLTGAVALLSSAVLAGCGSSKEAISVWVGQESVAFYKKEAKKFLADNKDFKYDITIKGADTGAAGGALVQDNTACADIVTVAHDNIGKLTQKSLILPITDPTLLAQIDADNPEAFKKVIVNKYGAGEDAKKYTFGVPYISQALFLYYNKKFVSDEQAKTFEGLEEAAKAAGKETKAFTVSGTDSFNMSFTMLARREKDKYTSTKIYEDFQLKNSFYQGNDAIAVTRWAQDEFKKTHGFMMPTSSGWAVDMQGENPAVLSMIGGAWHLNGVVKSLGEENTGCALIPTFKLGANHVEGLTANEFDSNVPVAGEEYRGGTFADCKVFVINNASKPEKTPYMNRLISYFASKEVQNRSLIEAGNVPAYKGGEEFVNSHKEELGRVKAEMAAAQLGMSAYGIAQPFATGALNAYFYSSGCDAIAKEMIINNENAYGTLRKVQEGHYNIEYIWTHGKKAPSYPDTLPAAMPTK